MFGPSFKGSKVKTLLNLAKARIKLLRNKRENALKQMRRDIAVQLSSNQEASARIRVEHIMREQNILGAYDVIELFCELIVVRLPIIEQQKECPPDLRESISSLIFAAPRCADLPELQQAKQALQAKYGKEFIAAAEELRPGCGVNRLIIEKLSVRAPSGEAKLKLLMEIAEEHKLDWDPSKSEEALVLKQSEDLLDPPQYNGYGDGRFPPGFGGPSGGDPRFPGGQGGPGGPGGGVLVMEPLPAVLNYQKEQASAPPKSQQWVDPESLDDGWAGDKRGAAGSAPGGSHGGNPLNYPPGPRVTPVPGGMAGARGGQGSEPGTGAGAGYPPEPPRKPAPYEPEEGYTMLQNQRQEEERRQRKAAIQETAARAREAAQRAAEAARSASRLASGGAAGGGPSPVDDRGRGKTDPDEDEENLRPVKPSKMSPSVDDDFPPPSRPAAGSHGGGGGGGSGGGFTAIGRYGVAGGSGEGGAPSSDGNGVRGGSSNDPPLVPPAPPGYATGSTFDDYVETGQEGPGGRDEVNLPDPPGARGFPERASVEARGVAAAQGTASGSRLPGIDDLAARFDKLRERSGQMGGY